VIDHVTVDAPDSHTHTHTLELVECWWHGTRRMYLLALALALAGPHLGYGVWCIDAGILVFIVLVEL
jgi:hypothetical protein